MQREAVVAPSKAKYGAGPIAHKYREGTATSSPQGRRKRETTGAPTCGPRLETRTKECMCAASPHSGAAKARELRTCDPIGSELRLGRAKPAETQVEAPSRSDVQFDGATWA